MSAGLVIAGMVLRAVFILLLVVIAVRVSAPQSEYVWLAYDTPGDLVRILLGLLFCAVVVIPLFRLPKDQGAARSWFFFSLAAVPFALICAIYLL